MMGTKARLFTPVTARSLDELVPADHFYRHLDRARHQAGIRSSLVVILPAFFTRLMHYWKFGSNQLRRHRDGGFAVLVVAARVN